MLRKLLLGGLVALSATLVVPGATRAENYFVDASGNNSHSGLSGKPVRDIQVAIDKCVSGADTVQVGTGSFGGFHINGKQGIEVVGVAGTVIDTVGANATEGIVLDNVKNVTLRGLVIQNIPGIGISITATGPSENVSIRNTRLSNNGGNGAKSSNLVALNTVNLSLYRVESKSAGKSGLYLERTVAASVAECVVADNLICGLWVNRGSGALVHRTKVSGSSSAEKTYAGILLTGVANATLRNNVVFENFGYGISVEEDSDATPNPSSNVDLVGNTVFQPSGDFCLRIRHSSPVRLFDNILLYEGSTSGSLYTIGGAPAESDYNLYSDSFVENVGGVEQTLAQWRTAHPGLDANSDNATSAIFFNLAGDDYHLKNSTVLGVDQGCGRLAVGEDHEGKQRPQGAAYDIGAYEYPQIGPDAGAPGLDAALPGPDAAEPGVDAALPGLDAAAPGTDAAQPGTDAAQPETDAAQPKEDAAEPPADAAEPALDASLPEADAGEADADLAPEDAAQPGEDAAVPLGDAAMADATVISKPDAGATEIPVFDLGGCGCSTGGAGASLLFFALAGLPLAGRLARRRP